MKKSEILKTEKLDVRVTPTDRAQLDMLATRRGVKLSVILREAINRALSASDPKTNQSS